MQDAIKLIAFFFLSVLSISAYTPESVRPENGYLAPDFKLVNDTATVSLNQFKGKYLILNFWNSSDAESRIRTINYDRFSRAYGDDRLAVISANIGETSSFVSTIADNDGLERKMQFSLSQAGNSRVYDDYRLNGRSVAYLIDPVGRIIDVNPGKEDLKKLLAE